MFISTIVSLLATILKVYLLCKHKKLCKLIASLVLHHVKEVGAEVNQKEINSACRTLAYIGIILTILSLAMVTILHYRKSKHIRNRLEEVTVAFNENEINLPRVVQLNSRTKSKLDV